MINKTGKPKTNQNDYRKTPLKNEKAFALEKYSFHKNSRKYRNINEIRNKNNEIHLNEIRHRMKNCLSMITSLISFEILNLSDEKSKKILTSTIRRINIISKTYDQLYNVSEESILNFKSYMRQLSEALYKVYAIDKVNIKLITEIEDIDIDPRKFEPLGLILNELLLNALKHAFPVDQAGCIKVELKTENGKINFSVSDNGTGFHHDFNINSIKSTGLNLVKIMVEQIEGTLFIDNKNGTLIKIIF